MTIPFRHSAILFLLCLSVLRLPAQEHVSYDAGAEKKFQSALEYYTTGAFYSAATQFEKLALEYPLNQRSTAAFIMAARAHLRAGAPVRSLRLLEDFRARFPGSEYQAESWLIAGDASSSANSPARAIECYLRAWSSGLPDTVLLKERLNALNKPPLTAFDRRVTRNLLSKLVNGAALASIIGLGKETAPSAATRKPAAVQDAPERRHPAIVAVALPLHHGEEGRDKLAAEILRGMREALRMHARSGVFPVTMELLDTAKNDSLEYWIDELEKNPRVIALLAGAFSEDAQLICEAAAERDLPVLLPTATDDGLTRLGSNIYQLNTSMEERARLLADFAALELDADEVMVLAPDKSWPRAMAEAFIERGRKLGLPVSDAVYYDPKKGDILTACKKIRGAAGGAKKRILFAPVRSRRDIASVLKGVEHSGCTRTVLGAGNWNYPDLLISHGHALTVYFEADVAPDSSSLEIKALRASLGLGSREPVPAEVLFGYDAMSLTLSLLADGPVTRGEARLLLRNVYHGLRAPVNLSEGRINGALNVLRYRDGSVQQLESFHAK